MSEEITVLDAVHIIPLKMRAWIDLTRQKNDGLHVNERDIRKHRQDVFRLFPLVNADARVGVSPMIYDDIQHFISEMRSSEFDLKAIHILIEKDDVELSTLYFLVKGYKIDISDTLLSLTGMLCGAEFVRHGETNFNLIP